MSATLALPDEHWSRLLEALGQGVETAGEIVAGVAASDVSPTLLGRQLIWAPHDSYIEREPKFLRLSPGAYVPALGAAADDKSVALFVHTHPGMAAEPSDLDERVFDQLRDAFKIRSKSDTFGFLIIGGTPDRPTFTGALEQPSGEHTIERLRVVGSRLSLHLPGEEGAEISAVFDRQVRALGKEGQRLLGALRVGVVGVGGTGSAVAEQLVRLGVKDLTIADHDEVTDTNVTRIYGSSLADVGRPKVEVMAEHAERIGFGTKVDKVASKITQRETAERFRHCDVVFGCTDDNAGRAILSRLAYWYLLPVFDMGVLINSPGGTIEEILGRVTVVQPGTVCLVCRRHLNTERIRDEMMTVEEREQRIEEGYAPGLADPDPAVIAFTTATAALAVTELLARLVGFGTQSASSELLARLHERRLNRNSAQPDPDHYCGKRNNWGRGDREPFLGMLWAGS